MARVYCAAVECRHNIQGKCCAAEITLNEGHVHTLHQGFLHHWTCTGYEESETAKSIREFVRKFMQERTEEK
ncbi:MAG: hypothetical protein IIV05_01580 [Ruminococcus sp.]|nr:hypothetical protein [Ruminococcus sp.]